MMQLLHSRMKENKIKLTPVEDINVTKKTDPQIWIYSTNKAQIWKRSVNETNAIISGFEDVNYESVHSAFDHSYVTI